MFGIGVAALGVVLFGAYLRFIRPWQLHWGRPTKRWLVPCPATTWSSILRLTPPAP